MDPIYIALAVIVLLMLAVGMLVAKGTGKGKVGIIDAEALRLAEEKKAFIVEEAKRDAERIIKDAELRAKEDAFKRREELSDIVHAFLQPPEVCNALRRLEAEPEVRGSRAQPVFEHLCRRQRTKRVVHLNRGKL